MSSPLKDRYQVLRNMGCGWFSAAFISWGNWVMNVPEGLIIFMTLTIEYDTGRKP